ncbi:helix-turn-helix domain-containing protein [Patescibacteria group bacterium]
MLKQILSIGEAANYLNVSIDTLRRWDKSGKLRAKKSPGGHRYYSKLDLDLYKQDIFALAVEWVLEKPQEPKNEFYCPTSIEFKTRLSKLQSALGKIEALQDYYPLIVAVAGEIGNNSYDHNLGNWPDIPGVFFGFDVNKKQIALADRGLGILRTLRRVRPSIENDEEALHIAFTETLSGRAPEARGNGLKFVREVITSNPLKLNFYSGSANVIISENDKKIKCEKINVYYSGCLALFSF